ncbi:HD domain-containing protein [Candidatus Bathyarchaeota archaeon]|nr:HD domain-containing protein [Candidatus Bathyarchaeota archaeon]MBS7628424.1 HD domain-containing protein [Candidatus Bathyarchaeota archaeon]
MESTKYWGFIKDPLYGYIRITEWERSIIDTAPVQRLRRIRQLSGAQYAYPAANHTRFEHSLGTMHLAGILAESLPSLSPEEKVKVKMASLLHDVGHGPYSHLFETLLSKYLGKTHEDMSLWIIRESEVGRALERIGLDPEEVGLISVGRLARPDKPYLNQIIRSSVDVDKMDFLLRDSYHTGASYGTIDIFRLIYTMDILDGNLAVDATALSTLETFLLARLESFRAIYFHRTTRAAQIMLIKALEKAKDELNLFKSISLQDYLQLDDQTLWEMLKHSKSRDIIMDLDNRRLLKCAYEKTFFVRDQLVTNIFNNEAVRRQIEEEIALKAGVPTDEVTIDVPSLPSVPYHYAIDIEPMNIPIFYKSKTGEKIPQRLGELSRIVDSLRVFLNIMRIYTKEVYREKVRKASTDVLGEAPLSSLVSY